MQTLLDPLNLLKSLSLYGFSSVGTRIKINKISVEALAICSFINIRHFLEADTDIVSSRISTSTRLPSSTLP